MLKESNREQRVLFCRLTIIVVGTGTNPVDSDPTLVLTGHGPATTIERERVTNPYLQNL